jgi:ATP-dependent RNA helicase DeaD
MSLSPGPLANRLFEKYSPEDVSAAALSMLFGEAEVEDIGEEVTYPASRKDFVRLFMTVGKIDKIKVGDIVKSISAEAGIPARKIGNIALFDKFSFVEVPANLADKVIMAINNSMMKGRKVRIQHAKRKER